MWQLAFIDKVATGLPPLIGGIWDWHKGHFNENDIDMAITNKTIHNLTTRIALIGVGTTKHKRTLTWFNEPPTIQ